VERHEHMHMRHKREQPILTYSQFDVIFVSLEPTRTLNLSTHFIPDSFALDSSIELSIVYSSLLMELEGLAPLRIILLKFKGQQVYRD